uniref:Uncharacterized protein n=1 Tax=Ditylenchus dipsaci TaxID=166011 RepID=A0A915E0S9_9BILA
MLSRYTLVESKINDQAVSELSMEERIQLNAYRRAWVEIQKIGTQPSRQRQKLANAKTRQRRISPTSNLANGESRQRKTRQQRKLANAKLANGQSRQP